MELISGSVAYPFQACTTIGVYGSTKSGKSYFVEKLLREKEWMFEEKPTKILYYYGVWTDSYRGMEKEMPDIQFQKGLPSLGDLESHATGSHTIVVLDDLLREICQSKSEGPVPAFVLTGTEALYTSEIFSTTKSVVIHQSSDHREQNIITP